MRITGLLAVIVVLSSQPAVAVKRHASIPEPLRGSWALSADACKNEDKSVFVLSANAFTGSEGSCSRNEPDFDGCRFQQPRDLPAVFFKRACLEAIGRRCCLPLPSHEVAPIASVLSWDAVWATHGRVVVIATAALRGVGNSPRQ